MADRFKGITLGYWIARHLNVDFKIHYISPDRLINYLLPNEHDWIIQDDDVIYNSKVSAIYNFNVAKHFGKMINEIQYLFKHYNQIHFRSNQATMADREYCSIFNKLFKPSEMLQKLIDYNKSQIGDVKISATFRFQQLLGDFKEFNYRILPDDERKQLINRHIECLKNIYNENNLDGDEKILVCSDSITFLEEAKKTSICLCDSR